MYLISQIWLHARRFPFSDSQIENLNLPSEGGLISFLKYFSISSASKL